MKFKKRYIIIILILLIIPLLFIFKKNNVKIFNINNENNKLATYDFQLRTDLSCDSWIDIDDLKANPEREGIVYVGDKLVVLDAKYTDLLSDLGPTGYTGFAYINDKGCSVEPNDVTSEINDTVLEKMKEYIINVRPTLNDDIYDLNSWRTQFNDVLDLCTSCSTEKLDILAETHTCTQELDSEGWPALRYDGYVGYGPYSGAAYSSESEWVNFYIDNCGGCNENYKYYIKTSASKEALSIKCGGDVLNELGYHTHTLHDQSFCYKDGLLNHKGECAIECTSENRQEIIDNKYISKAQTFNNVCTGLEPIPLGTIKIEFNGGWGPETLGSNWGGGDGSYTVIGIPGATGVINFNGQNLTFYDYALRGWSKNEDNCELATSSLIETAAIAIEDGATYYACYGDGTKYKNNFFDNTFFETVGGTVERKTGTEYIVSEETECLQDTVYDNNISEVPMKLTNTYIKKSYETIKVPSGNKYCNVSCVDTVKVSYPNIFETVPAGQYFELMYEPEVKATRTCQTQFRYTDWAEAYTNAVEEEQNAMTNLNYAIAYNNAASALQDIRVCCSCCGGGRGCRPSYGYEDLKTRNYYPSSSPTQASARAYYSTCGLGPTKGEVQASARGNLTSAKQRYKEAVNKRIALEQFNLQCYTILNQKSDESTYESTKAYNTVFRENYTYEDKFTSEEILETNTLNYNINTPFVDSPISNQNTKDNYVNYINTNAELNTSNDLFATKINPVGRTINFFSIYPSLTLKYDDGSEGSPSDFYQEQELDVEAHVKKDTGNYTSETSGTYTKDTTPDSFTTISSFYYNGVHDEYIKFKPYKAEKTYRTVEYYFTFHEAKEYLSEIYTGEVKAKGTVPSTLLPNYTDLIRKQIITLNGSTEEKKIYNNVLPVSLKATKGKYGISLELTDKPKDDYLENSTNTTYSTYLKLNDTPFRDEGFTGEYSCKYEITNDALKLKDETSTDYQDLKSNTIFRSISPSKLDPNDRASTGKLGENWLNNKGQDVKKLIENKEKHDGKTNDTYNPDNLEYSFTLTPTIIQKIKNYNNEFGRTYDDFNLECATEDMGENTIYRGTECKSEFLTNLSDGIIGTYAYPNYHSVNEFDSSNLEEVRTKWKYYIGDNSTIFGCDKITGTNIAKCDKDTITLDIYNELYERWGVLP